MKKIISALLPLIVSCILTSCGTADQQAASTSNEDTVSKNMQQDDSNTASDNGSPAGETTNSSTYKYEPSVSVITGTITSETFYGPPGFGETPDLDEKEKIFILKLDHSITVMTEEGTDEFNITRGNITELQLSSPEIKLTHMENKKVKLTGTLYGAHTGHHYTDVLMAVEDAEQLK